MEETTRQFFERVRSVDLLLPDGWFGGRPGELSETLTMVTQRKLRLLVELSDHMLLSFSGDVELIDQILDSPVGLGTRTLEFRGFSQAVVDFVPFGRGHVPRAHIYRSGSIYLVSTMLGLDPRSA